MTQKQDTQHALLVPLGPFVKDNRSPLRSGSRQAQAEGLGAYAPGKVMEFLVEIYSGVKYLQDISLIAHPLDNDETIVQTCGQAGWAAGH